MLEMLPGTDISVPVDSYAQSTVRNYASDLSFLYLRTYKVSIDRRARAYKISRER